MKGESLRPRATAERKMYPCWLLLPALALYLIFAIYPTLSNAYYSLTDWSMQKSEISFVGLTQFIRILKNPKFWGALKNSAIYGGSITILKVFLGLLLALGLNRKIRSASFLRSVYFLPIIISTVAVGLIFRSLMHPTNGFLNQMLMSLGVKNPPQWITDPTLSIWCCVIEETWRSTGLCMAVFLSGLQSIPKDYYEAATIDGASAWQRFCAITWPLLRPTLTINVMMSLVNGLRGFEPIYYLTGGGPGTSSQTVMTLAYKYMAEGLYSYSAAINFFLIFVILLLSIPLLRMMTRKEVEL